MRRAKSECATGIPHLPTGSAQKVDWVGLVRGQLASLVRVWMTEIALVKEAERLAILGL